MSLNSPRADLFPPVDRNNIVAPSLLAAMFAWLVIRLENVSRCLTPGPRDELYELLMAFILTATDVSRDVLEKETRYLELEYGYGSIRVFTPKKEEPSLSFNRRKLEETLGDDFVCIALLERPFLPSEITQEFITQQLENSLFVPKSWLNESGPALTGQLSNFSMAIIKWSPDEIELCIPMSGNFVEHIPYIKHVGGKYIWNATADATTASNAIDAAVSNAAEP